MPEESPTATLIGDATGTQGSSPNGFTYGSLAVDRTSTIMQNDILSPKVGITAPPTEPGTGTFVDSSSKQQHLSKPQEERELEVDEHSSAKSHRESRISHPNMMVNGVRNNNNLGAVASTQRNSR